MKTKEYLQGRIDESIHWRMCQQDVESGEVGLITTSDIDGRIGVLKEELKEIESRPVEKLVSLQNADWQVISKVGNPTESDRYLVCYRIKGMTYLKYFTMDYDTVHGWFNLSMFGDIELVGWQKINEFNESILSN